MCVKLIKLSPKTPTKILTKFSVKFTACISQHTHIYARPYASNLLYQFNSAALRVFVRMCFLINPSENFTCISLYNCTCNQVNDMVG